MGMVNIKGLDKAEVLHALWRHSHVQGLSFMGLTPEGFTLQKAHDLIKERQENSYRLYFDYVEGHVIKCDLSGDSFDAFLYDRDCGAGAAEAAIDELRCLTTLKDAVTKTANEIDFENEMQASKTAREFENTTKIDVKISYDFTTYTNKNMRALRDILCTMVSSAQCAFANDQGIIIDSPYYMAFEDGDKCYTILKLDTLTRFTVKLPSIPDEKDSDMFTISLDTFLPTLPTNVRVYMREDDEVLNIPDMRHLKATSINDVNELLEYIKQKVTNYNNTDPMFNHTIYTHDEHVFVNRDAISMFNKDRQTPKTASFDICKPNENDNEGEKR